MTQRDGTIFKPNFVEMEQKSFLKANSKGGTIKRCRFLGYAVDFFRPPARNKVYQLHTFYHNEMTTFIGMCIDQIFKELYVN